MSKHSKTCSCKDCINKEALESMYYWVFYEHRGYMEDPKPFNTWEEADKFAKKNKSFMQPYIVFGSAYESFGNKTKSWNWRQLSQKEKQDGK